MEAPRAGIGETLQRQSLATRVGLVTVASLTVLLLALAPPTWVPLWAGVVMAGILAAFAAWVLIRARADRRRYESTLASAAARQAVLEDRLEITRGVHDIVSHSLGAISLRAGVGARLGATDPAEARAALDEVAELSRSATQELRQLLAALRDPAAPAPLEPSPGLRDLTEVVARYRRAGLTVAAVGLPLEDDARPTVRDAAAYHVVAEALSNVARHAGPASAVVEVVDDGGTLGVTVRDDGVTPGWAGTPGAGHGLDLVRRRVEAAGGYLEAGPVEGGYYVRAEFPGGAP